MYTTWVWFAIHETPRNIEIDMKPIIDKCRCGVLGLWVAEGRHSVGDGLDTSKSRGPGGEGLENQEQGDALVRLQMRSCALRQRTATDALNTGHEQRVDREDEAVGGDGEQRARTPSSPGGSSRVTKTTNPIAICNLERQPTPAPRRRSRRHPQRSRPRP